MNSTNRQLIQTNEERYHGWLCSHCGQQFLKFDCALPGLTRDQIVKHFTAMREQAFAKHECTNASKCD
jgi:hypothetical protein